MNGVSISGTCLAYVDAAPTLGQNRPNNTEYRMSKGKKFEEQVRRYAAVRFAKPFRPEHLAGVDFDAVASLRPDYKIIVEATVNNTLEKVRGDIARLQIAKHKLMAEGIFAETYIVLPTEPTNYMQEGAKAAKIEIASFEAFYRGWYDATAYFAARIQHPFGSAIQEGQEGPDSRPYVPVHFEDQDGRSFSVQSVADLLFSGRKVVLTGDFGTGKSRAIQQLFSMLRKDEVISPSPIAIDLRHMWGTTSADEVLRRHFSMLQMGEATNKVSDALHHDEFFLLLDGFDELAIQEWGGSAAAVVESRAKTMEPVRDLLNRTKNGALITGRAHYFNNDEELLSSLGLPPDTLFLKTPEQFSPEDTFTFMRAMGYEGDIPIWLPRKPLIAEMYADFAKKGAAPVGETRAVFWSQFMDALCRRDAKIRQSYDPEAIKNILCYLSRKARITESGVGPILPDDVQEAFTKVVGQLPAQEAASMLQRLPGLGRVASETEDRQFIDDFIVEGLRGQDVVNIISTFEYDDAFKFWKHSAGEIGVELIAEKSNMNFVESDAIGRLLEERSRATGALNADITSALLLAEGEEIDFAGAEVKDGYFETCDFSGKKVRNLLISESEIRSVNLYNMAIDNVRIVDSVIEILDGASADGIPDWISRCEISKQTQMDTISRIRKSQLKPAEMILVTILRKTFFQPGSGRKEDALLRGLGEFGDAKLQTSILKLLISRGFLSEAPGRSGKLYIPERSKTGRAKRMISQLQQSEDDIWKETKDI